MTRSRVSGGGRSFLLLLAVLLGIVPASAQVMTVTTSSDQARMLYTKAVDAMEQQRVSDALPLYEQAIKADPQFALAWLGKASTEPSRTQREADLQKAAELAKNATAGEQLLVEGALAFFTGDGNKLKAIDDQLVSQFPGDKHVLLQVAGSSMMLFNNNQKALDLATKAAAVDPKFGPAFNLIGYAQVGLGNLQAAEAALKTYTQLTPNEPNPYDSYAELLLNMGRYDESIEQYANALKRDPKYPSAILGTGHDYLFKGDYARARENYQKLIDNSAVPADKLQGYEFLAASYVHEGKTADAVKVLEARQKYGAETGTPAEVTSYQQAGYVLTEAGRADEGLKYFEKARQTLQGSKLGHGDRDMVTATGGMLEAYALAAAGQVPAAHAMLEKVTPVIEKRGQPQEMMNLHTAMGLVANAEGNLDEALKQFAQGDQDNAINSYHQALALEKKGDASKAMVLYTKLSKSNRNDLGLAAVRKAAVDHVAGVQAGAGPMK